MKQIMAISLIGTLLLSLVSCAGKQVPLATAADTLRSTTENNLQHSYRVTFKDGTTYHLDDDDIDVRGDTIGIRFVGTREYRYYRADQFAEIRYKTKKHTWLGAGIGAGVGAVGSGLAFALGARCTAGSSTDCDDPGLYAFGIAGFGLLGAGVGLGIGAAIGAAVPKKKQVEVTVSPQVYGNNGMKITGGGLGISGRF